MCCASDHYTGLRENWDYGPIYCSQVTGKLVVKMTGVSPELIHTLDWETPTIIEGELCLQSERIYIYVGVEQMIPL
jgi:hypothetical protein